MEGKEANKDIPQGVAEAKADSTKPAPLGPVEQPQEDRKEAAIAANTNVSVQPAAPHQADAKVESAEPGNQPKEMKGQPEQKEQKEQKEQNKEKESKEGKEEDKGEDDKKKREEKKEMGKEQMEEIYKR